MNDKLREIARKQCGYFTAGQALDAGYASSVQKYHVTQGNWLKCERGIYRLPTEEDSRISAFVFWSLWAIGSSRSRRAVVSHESALYHYGLLLQPPARTHLCVSSLRSKSDHPQCRLHTDTLVRSDYLICNGYRITTPRKTLELMQPDLIQEQRWLPTVRQALERNLISAAGAMALVEGSGFPAPCSASSVAAVPETVLEKKTMQPVWSGYREAGRRWAAAGRSFTLVEMLVVIAIISILAALLLPSLQRAQDTARGVSCRSNLRQCGIAFTTYADDNKGVIALNSNFGSGTYRWWSFFLTGAVKVTSGYPNATTDYLTQRSVILCPSEAPYQYKSLDYCYGGRNFMDSTQSANFVPAGYNGGTLFVRQNQLVRPSTYVYIADNYSDDVAGQFYFLSRAAAPLTGALHLRHGDHANTLFADSHVGVLGVENAREANFVSGYLYDKSVIYF